MRLYSAIHSEHVILDLKVDDSDSDEDEVPQEPKSVLSILDERKKALERSELNQSPVPRNSRLNLSLRETVLRQMCVCVMIYCAN